MCVYSVCKCLTVSISMNGFHTFQFELIACFQSRKTKSVCVMHFVGKEIMYACVVNSINFTEY